MFIPQTGCLIWLKLIGVICLISGAYYFWIRPIRNVETDKILPITLDTVILERIHMVGEFTTAVASVQTIIKSTEVREWLSMQVGSTEILYVAVGEVRAGINLMGLEEKALVIEGTKATVILPECRILDSKIDVERSYVFDIKRSIMLSPQAIHLQSTAERQALKEIQDVAVQAGVLEQAQKQAQVMVRYFLEASGMTEVEFGAKVGTHTKGEVNAG